MIARLVLLAVLVLPVAGGQVPPAPRSQAEAQRERAADRIRALQQEAEALAGREKTLLGELRRLEIERDLRTAEIERLAPEIESLEREISATTARLGELDEAVRRQQPVLAARLVDTYKLGRAGYARLWFAVDDLRALGRAYRLVSALARIDRDRIADYRATLAALSATRGQLDRRLAEVSALNDEARHARAAADAAVAQRVALVAEADRRRDLNAQLVGELQQAHARLQQALSAAPRTGDPAAAGLASPVVLPIRPFEGQLAWPVGGTLVTPFGPRVHPRFGTTTVSSGIEISAAEGAPAHAVHEGTVAFADAFSGFGLLVILDHGHESYSLYGHLATIEVGRGAQIEAGTIVGTVGRGLAGRPSLYFELRIDGQPVDPVQWFKRKAGS